MKLSEWAETCAVIEASFPGRVAYSEETIRVTHRMWMQDWPQQIVLRALQLHVDGGAAHPPSVGQLIEHAKRIGPTEQFNFDTAWGELLSAVRHVGYVRLPTWSDPILERVMHVYTWKRFCETEEDQLGFVRNHLKGMYEAERSHRELVAFRLQHGDLRGIGDGGG